MRYRNINRFLLTFLVLLTMFLTACTHLPGTTINGFRKQNVVYHVNDIDTAYGLLRSVKNHLNAVGDENANIIAVTHGSGAFILVTGARDNKGRTFDGMVQSLVNRGVKFQICATTIKNKKIPTADLNKNATIVSLATVQLVRLQQLGFKYIKP